MNAPDQPAGLAVREHTAEDGSRVLVPAGELDIASVDLLNAAVERACGDGARSVTLDLRELSFIDSTGLAAIVLASRLCDTNGLELLLIPGSPATQRLFEMTGLIDVLPFRASDEQAGRAEAAGTEDAAAGQEREAG
jgi:anti-sigma B factor antagonist